MAAPLLAFIAGELINGVGYSAIYPFVAARCIVALLPLAILRVERPMAAIACARLSGAGAERTVA